MSGGSSFYVAITFFLIGWIAQQLRSETTERIALINDHIKDVEKFVELSMTYWLTDGDADASNIQASKVRAAFYPISKFYGEPERENTRGLDSAAYVKLYRSATGGAFQTSDRKADPSRAENIADIAATIVFSARVRRRHLATIGGFFGDIFRRIANRIQNTYRGSRSRR